MDYPFLQRGHSPNIFMVYSFVFWGSGAKRLGGESQLFPCGLLHSDEEEEGRRVNFVASLGSIPSSELTLFYDCIWKKR